MMIEIIDTKFQTRKNGTIQFSMQFFPYLESSICDIIDNDNNYETFCLSIRTNNCYDIV